LDKRVRIPWKFRNQAFGHLITPAYVNWSGFWKISKPGKD
jgi:hypothetical protein